MMMIWSCWWYEAEREIWVLMRVLLSAFSVFLNFSPKPTTTEKKRRMKERSLKSVERWKARIFLSQNRFFSHQNCQKVHEKETTQTHRRDQQQTFFPNTTKTTQHQSPCSLLLLTRFDHHHRSSRRMSPPNLLDLLRIDRRRWKSARWGWKKVRYCFRFRRLAS